MLDRELRQTKRDKAKAASVIKFWRTECFDGFQQKAAETQADAGGDLT